MTDSRARHRSRYWRDRDTDDKQCPSCGRVVDEQHVHHNDGNDANGHPANLRGRCPTCHFAGEHDRPDDIDRDRRPSPGRTKPRRPSVSGPPGR